jgi:hypothetical protein
LPLTSPGHAELKTATEASPHPAARERAMISANVTYLLQQINNGGKVGFAIDRANEKTCKTPRRNAQVRFVVLFSFSFVLGLF